MQPTNHANERILSALVVLEALELFFIAPMSAEFRIPVWSFAVMLALNVVAVLAVVWRRPIAVAAVLLAAGVEVTAVALRILLPTAQTEALDFAAALILLVALTVVVAMTVFGPGRVTVHRIVGAIAIYLNVAATFALAYRMIASLGPGKFSPPLGVGGAGHTLSTLIYFSFETLTTTGYGDIVPVEPFARSLTNVESVIGQLFPATLLARLITLELEHRRSKADPAA
jgi:hypothetical protein